MPIESTDGLSEALEKIRQAAETSPEKRIPLVIPDDSPIARNRLGRKILQKEAQQLGVELEGEETPPSLGFQEGVDVRPPTDQIAEAGQTIESGGRKLLAILKSPAMKKFLLFSGVGLAGLGVITAILWTVPKATVRLEVRSESLVQSFELIASPSATAVDAERKILPAVLVEVEEKGERKAEAAGRKEKGTKASGELVIYNWTDDDKTFSPGTVATLIRVEGEKLKFLLDEELTVPAQTASVSATPEERTTTYTPGKETVGVGAEQIGSEYNLEADSQFSIAGLSTDEFLAQNEEAFEGGNKEEVTVVSDEDQVHLRQQLEEELKNKAREDILSRTVGDQKLNEEAIVYEIVGQTFDKEVGEEAEDFTLTLLIKGSALIYSQQQLDNLVAALLAEKVPADFDLSDKELVTEVSAAKVVEGEDGKKMLQILTKTKAAVISKVDENRIKEDLVGRGLVSAQKYLESIPGVATVEITIFPPLPGPLTRMPRLTSRIDILLEHE
jgi:hypothetical protein